MNGGIILPKSKRLLPYKSDTVLIVFLTLFGIVLTGFIYAPKESGKQLEVRQNGKKIMVLPLSQDIEKTIRAKNGDTNTFYIKNNTVLMSNANCGDKTCVHTGSISKAGETIVCLPHRLVLSITGKDERPDSVPDAIVK